VAPCSSPLSHVFLACALYCTSASRTPASSHEREKSCAIYIPTMTDHHTEREWPLHVGHLTEYTSRFSILSSSL
jgi:hypothetical protein